MSAISGISVMSVKDPVDNALDDSFPASDPPSTSVPVTAGDAVELPAGDTTLTLYRIIEGAAKQNVLRSNLPRSERRWATPETGLIRMATSQPMAILDFLTGLEGITPQSLMMLRMRIERTCVARLSEYPLGWDALPYQEAIRGVGDRWAQACETLALQVPSAVCAGEHSVLINPAHPDAAGFSSYELHAFRLDPRLRI